jgi:hypothetical protein
LREFHTSLSFSNYQYLVLPFLRLSFAMPILLFYRWRWLDQNTKLSKKVAFKFFFVLVVWALADSVTFTPEFEKMVSCPMPRGSWIYALVSKVLLELWMRLSPAIHLSGCGVVGGKNGWFHQILGVIYTSGILRPPEPRSVFIDYIAVQEPSMTHLKRTMSLPLVSCLGPTNTMPAWRTVRRSC